MALRGFGLKLAYRHALNLRCLDPNIEFLMFVCGRFLNIILDVRMDDFLRSILERDWHLRPLSPMAVTPARRHAEATAG